MNSNRNESITSNWTSASMHGGLPSHAADGKPQAARRSARPTMILFTRLLDPSLECCHRSRGSGCDCSRSRWAHEEWRARGASHKRLFVHWEVHIQERSNERRIGGCESRSASPESCTAM